MTIEEKLVKIAENDQSIYNNLKDIIDTQEEIINPEFDIEIPDIGIPEEGEMVEVKFYINDKELAIGAFSSSGNIIFTWDYMLFDEYSLGDYYTSNFLDTNGYITFMHHTIENSEGKLVKKTDTIINNANYYLSSDIEFTIVGHYDGKEIAKIQIQTGNAYAKAIDYLFD